MRSRVQLSLIDTPQLTQLPHLPDWAAPNGWDFWGRPWAYMDAPSGNSVVGVEEGKAWVTVAVLVQLDREVQYLPDQNVAKSASATIMRVRKTRVFNDNGSLREEDSKRISLYTAARTLFPCGWGSDHSEPVHSLLKCWHAYHASRVGQRFTPPMPQGDVTPEGCDRPVPPQEPKTLEVSASGPSEHCWVQHRSSVHQDSLSLGGRAAGSGEGGHSCRLCHAADGNQLCHRAASGIGHSAAASPTPGPH